MTGAVRVRDSVRTTHARPGSDLGLGAGKANGPHRRPAKPTRLVDMRKVVVVVATLVLTGVVGSGCSIQIGTACYQVAGHAEVCSK